MALEKLLEDLKNRFTYHAPITDQAQRYEDIRRIGFALASLMATSCPESRELSLAFTNLEQAIFWANASISRNEKETENK